MNRKLNPLCQNHMFVKAYKKGKSAVNKYTAVYALKNYKKNPDGSQTKTKLGIAINAKLGKAVKRSRAKRIIREAYSFYLPQIKDGFIVVIAARGACFDSKVKSTQVKNQLLSSLEQLQLLK